MTTQLERRRQVWQLTAHCCREWFDPAGNWIDTSWADPHVKWIDVQTRNILWLCFGLLDGDPAAIALANAAIEKLEFHRHVPARSEAEITSPFDIFVTNHAIHILATHAAVLTPAAREKLETWARVGLADFPGNRQCDYQFHGFNDNMPAKATLGLILGGEYFDDNRAVQHGLWNLRQLRDLLTRRGLFSEYNSPTYTPFTLANLTGIALHARNDEARDLAGQACARLWAEIYGHFHPPTGMSGGPFSRAYTGDTVGHLSTLNNVLWLVHGENIFPNPIDELSRDPLRLVCNHGSRSDYLGRFCLVASNEYIPPPFLVEWMQNRTYPFQIRATAERGDGGESFHGGEVVTAAYQEEDFSLATTEGESWTQVESWYLRYRLKNPARSIDDVRVAYSSYFINDQAPVDNRDKVDPKGVPHVLQDRRVSLLVTRPVFSLVGKELDALKLCVILPTHLAPLGRIEIRDGHVFIEDGPVRIAFRALNAAKHAGAISAPIKLEPVPNYQVISFYNYAGPKRTFTRDELAAMINGFVSVLGLTAEETFDQFTARVLAAECLDYWYFKCRTLRYKLGDSLLELGYAVEADRIRFAAVNGRPNPRPIWDATAMPASGLPFLSGDPTPNPLTIPYEHLRVVWSPDSPWLISSRGADEPNADTGP